MVIQEKPVEQTKVAVAEREQTIEELLNELRLSVLQHSQSQWRGAELVYELTEYGMTLDKIKEAAGLNVEISVLSRWRSTFEYYCKRMGLCDMVKAYPMHTLYELRNVFLHANADKSFVVKALEEVRSMERSAAVAHVKEMLGMEEDKPEFASLRIPRPVYEQFEEVANTMVAAAQSVGLGMEMTPAAVFELMLEPYREMSFQEVKAFLQHVHGEVDGG